MWWKEKERTQKQCRRARIDEGWQRFLRPFFFLSAFFLCSTLHLCVLFIRLRLDGTQFSQSTDMIWVVTEQKETQVRAMAAEARQPYVCVFVASCIRRLGTMVHREMHAFLYSMVSSRFSTRGGSLFALNDFYLQFVATKTSERKERKGCVRLEKTAEIGNHFYEKNKIQETEIITVPVASSLLTQFGLWENLQNPFHLVEPKKDRRRILHGLDTHTIAFFLNKFIDSLLAEDVRCAFDQNEKCHTQLLPTILNVSIFGRRSLNCVHCERTELC